MNILSIASWQALCLLREALTQGKGAMAKDFNDISLQEGKAGLRCVCDVCRANKGTIVGRRNKNGEKTLEDKFDVELEFAKLIHERLGKDELIVEHMLKAVELLRKPDSIILWLPRLLNM